MKSRFVLLWLFGSVAVFAVGCAERKETALLEPSPDELPNLAPPAESNSVLSVQVEGRTAPTRILVQKFDPPAHTAEEKKALGEEPPIMDYLALYRPGPGPGVGNFDGRVGVGIGGMISPAGSGGERSRAWEIDSHSSAGPDTGVYPIALSISGITPFFGNHISIWPYKAGVEVEQGLPSHIAAHERR